MKKSDMLLLGGAAVAAFLLLKKNTGTNPLDQAKAAVSNTLGDLQSALAKILPTNTAGGLINIGSTGTGPINNIQEQINMGLLSSEGLTPTQTNAVARALTEPLAWQAFLDWQKTAQPGDIWTGYYGPASSNPGAGGYAPVELYTSPYNNVGWHLADADLAKADIYIQELFGKGVLGGTYVPGRVGLSADTFSQYATGIGKNDSNDIFLNVRYLLTGMGTNNPR